MQGKKTACKEVRWAEGCGAAGHKRVEIMPEESMMRSHLVRIVSHLAELGVFFAAAAALGAGVLELR